MIIAADYPFLDILWTMIIFFTWVVWIWMMVVILTDVFRRRDIGGFAKAAWVVFLIVLPFLGVLVYLIAQHNGMAERNAQQMQAVQQQFDERVREVAASEGPAAEIEKAARLRDAGTITGAEFESLKAKALAAH
jgi:energy-coupling factor transporter transmembrane protein EcfT